jgi:hypothetical protein
MDQLKEGNWKKKMSVQMKTYKEDLGILAKMSQRILKALINKKRWAGHEKANLGQFIQTFQFNMHSNFE